MENRYSVQPSRPPNIPTYAEACLQALVANHLNDRISLGGAFGLLHYLDYRSTHDVGTWWHTLTTTQDKEQVIKIIETALSQYGQVQQRTWGDVVSIELIEANETVFSFQIAQRSAQFQPSVSNEIRRPTWNEAVDQCRLLTSPAYHLVRSWHNLPALPYLGQELAYIRDDPNLAYV